MLLIHQTQKHMPLMLFVYHGKLYNFMHFHLSVSSKEFFRKLKKNKPQGWLLSHVGPHKHGGPALWIWLFKNPCFCLAWRALILHAEPQTVHPSFNKLQLICCHLSGVASLAEQFQKGCRHYHAIMAPIPNLLTKMAQFSVTRGRLIPFVQL